MSQPGATWSDLDKRVGAALVGRQLVAPTALAGLTPQQVQATPYRGSLLLGKLLGDGRLVAAQADALLTQLGVTADDDEMVRPTHRLKPLEGMTDLGASSAGSGVFPPTQGSGVFSGTFTPSGPSVDPGSGVFAGSGTFGLTPGAGAPAPQPRAEAAPPGDDKTQVFTDSGTFGLTPQGNTPAASTPRQSTYRPDAPTNAGDGGQAAKLDLAALGLVGDRYEVLEREEGTWTALDRRVERRVELRVPVGAEPEPGYFRHARLLAQLDHPAIPQVHDVGSLEGRPYYSLDQVDGASLAELLRGRPALPALLRAFLTVCDAVEHANQRGVVHGHLQPRHVALGSFGQVWVTGWDHAWVLEEADAGVRSAAQGLHAPPELDARGQLAPELRRKDARPTPRADVYALGVVLHGILAGGRLPQRGKVALGRLGRVPRDLSAVTRKALRAVPRERYASAAELRDDVRRFLDGKAVSAAQDSFLDALLRLRRRYPVASAVVGVGALLVVAVSAVTYRLIDRRVDTARAVHAEAKQRAQEADELARLADQARASAERQAAVTAKLRTFEAALGRGLAGGRDSEQQFDRAAQILEDAKADAGLDRELRARLHRARGNYYLSRAEPPEPDRALVEFQSLTKLLPRDAEGWFRCFLAARRLPGRAAERAEQDALKRLEGLAGPFSALGKYVQEVRALEERARRLAAKRPPEMVPWDSKRDRVYADLQSFAQTRWDVAIAHEMLGRYRAALCCPGVHRQQQVLLEGKRVKIEGTRGTYGRSFGDFFRAINLDPLDPRPRTTYLTTFNAKFGLHSPWRYKGGWPLSRLAEACRAARRPEPHVALATELHKLGRVPSTLPLLERALGLPSARDPRQETAGTVSHARLLMARARLDAGLTADQDLSGIPEALKPEAEVLRGWDALARGKVQAGVRRMLSALRGQAATQQAIQDLTSALCEPRADPRAVAQALGQVIPPGQGPDPYVIARLVLARATQLSRIGRVPPQELQRLQRQRWSPTSWEAGMASLAEARNLAKVRPRHPGAHVLALRLWAELNVDVASREPLAAQARDLIVERLTKLGAPASTAFRQVADPVRELLVRRLYVAPEVWDWQGKRGEGNR